MERNYKKFVLKLIAVFGAVLLLIAGIVYVTDPYVYYHKDGVYKRTFTKNFNMRYQIPGMIRNLEYETLFVGTSMGHNFKEEKINELFQTSSFNATISGSSAREQRKAMELAMKSQDVKHVFWEINYDSLAGEADRVDATFPKFLYDRNIINDIPYLLSYEAFKKIDHQWENQHLVKSNVDPYSFYKFGENKKPLTVEMMKKELEGQSAPPAEAHTLESYMESFKVNMLPMIKKYPDTKFTFMYTPYPITRHMIIQEDKPGINEARLEAKLKIYEELQKFNNAVVYDFQDDADITFNVGNYIDRSHYFPYINDLLLEKMAATKPIQSMEEYEKKVENLSSQLENFSYDQLKEKPLHVSNK
ncbi:hypothetical protein J7I80_15240 [Bacillus sp. ISL-41]|uniref:hypothetical protein n=1 Tax=Bacillus sp. ISL-41 TaxID=2819127 RepID=UPI001BEBE6D0|nr:hypothetical protein [Bacillus sp. ISL-41]MBT2643595.1 hypothetical protein [Bacillus sp. ISL-41]